MIWKIMRQRCNCPTCVHYKNYGARGIRVCNDWNDFMNFFTWATNNGYSDDKTIERIDVNGNYEPLNCEWIDAKRQANNKTTTHWIVDSGEKMSMADYCRKYEIKYYTFAQMIRRGASVQEATEQCLKLRRDYGYSVC